MHGIELIELASTYTLCASSMVTLRCAPLPEHSNSYWLCNRFRHESWATRLNAHREAVQNTNLALRYHSWHDILPVMQEVLLAEPLVRCVAYHAQVMEERELDHNLGPLAHSSLAATIEARQRCLHMIVFGRGMPVDMAARLNRMRRWLELYVDTLLAAMPPVATPDTYCFDSPTVVGVQTARGGRWLTPTEFKFRMLASVRALRRLLLPEADRRAANGMLNDRIAAATLALLPEQVFSQVGVCQSHDLGSYMHPQHGAAESTGCSDDIAVPPAFPLNLLHAPPQRASARYPISKGRW